MQCIFGLMQQDIGVGNTSLFLSDLQEWAYREKGFDELKCIEQTLDLVLDTGLNQ